MTENSLYRTVAVSTLATPKEMWALPDENVKAALLNQLPAMHRIANNWLSSRPAMRYSFSGQGPSSVPYNKDDLNRRTDRVRYATEESHELLRAVRAGKDLNEVKLEFGDVIFWLLLFDQTFNPEKRVRINVSRCVGDEPDVVFGKETFKHSIDPEDKSEMTLFDGEEAVVLAVGMLGRQLANDVHRHIGRDRIYAYLDFAILTLGRYALLQNWNLTDIITKVAEKNDRNYPKELFDWMSPFAHDVDAIDFLNVLKQPGRMRSFFADLVDEQLSQEREAELNHNKPSKEIVKKYREIISNQLSQIIDSPGNPYTQLKAEYLIGIGQWDDNLL